MAPETGRLFLVGNSGGTHVGQSLHRAGQRLGLECDFFDMRQAHESFPAVTWFSWNWRGHRPARLGSFSRRLLRECLKIRPRWMLTTGLAPVDEQTLVSLGRMGTCRINYLTDDPWNPKLRSSWFFRALPHYDRVFSVRRSNLEDLRKAGCPSVEYLPFGFDPDLFYREKDSGDSSGGVFLNDVIFAGGADRDRLPYLAAVIRAGFRVALYGDYWRKYPETAPYARGLADPAVLRRAFAESKVGLGLVRRANRDGHSMRSFEVPAMGCCFLAEDTQEHRRIFGDDGETAVYFRTLSEMLSKLRWLLENDSVRLRLAEAVHKRITGGGNTYADRLQAMLQETP